MNVNMILIFISVTVILNFVKSEPRVLKNPFILLTEENYEYFEHRWYVSLPKELIQHKETICKSVTKAKLFDLKYNTIPWDEIKEAEQIPGLDRKYGTINLKINSNETSFPTSVLSCMWNSLSPPTGSFYLGIIENFDGYIFLIYRNIYLRLKGLVMEFLNLKQVSEDGYDILQKNVKNYTKKRSLKKGSHAWSARNKLLIFEQKFQFSKLCVSVQLVMLEKNDKVLSDDYLTVSFINDDVLVLMDVKPSSKCKIKDFVSKLLLLTHKMVKCLFTRPYLAEYILLRHPTIQNQFFVIYDNYMKVTLFESSTNLYVSSKW